MDISDGWTEVEGDEIHNPEQEAAEFEFAQMNNIPMPASHVLTLQVQVFSLLQEAHQYLNISNRLAMMTVSCKRPGAIQLLKPTSTP